MDAKTLEALKASIAKWERNAEATDPFEYRTHANDCPLCDLFNHKPDRCEGCPVFDKTDERFCRGTPYMLACVARYDWRDCVDGAAARAHAAARDAAARAHAAARDEVAFLKSLLPEETP